MRWRWLPAVLVVALCGCGAGVDGASRSDESRQQAARAELARYDRAVLAAGRLSFVPVGDLTGQVGAWRASDGEKKRALQSGRILPTAALPAAPRKSGTVTWSPGGTHSRSR